MNKQSIDNPNYEHEQQRLSRVIRELWAPGGDKYMAAKADEQWEKSNPEDEDEGDE